MPLLASRAGIRGAIQTLSSPSGHRCPRLFPPNARTIVRTYSPSYCQPAPTGRAAADLRRPLSRLCYGLGPPRDEHFCVAAPLARLEMRAAHAALLRSFPALRLSPPGATLPVNPNVKIGGLLSLPVC